VRVLRYGLRVALNLGIVKPEQTVMAVQGWKGGLGHVSAMRMKSITELMPLQTNTLRILSVPTDATDLDLQSIDRP
jgi:pyruvate kinase